MKRLTPRVAWTAVALLSTFVGCKSVPVEQAAPVVALPGADSVQASTLEAGRSIYIHECGKCHTPKPVTAYTMDRWNLKILPLMTKWVRLSPEQTQTLTSYILAVHQNPTPTPAATASVSSGPGSTPPR